MNKLDRERADFRRRSTSWCPRSGTRWRRSSSRSAAERVQRHRRPAPREGGPVPVQARRRSPSGPTRCTGSRIRRGRKLIEAVAESDDALIEQYLDEGTLPEAVITQGAKDGFTNARLAPVFVARLPRRSGSIGCWTSSSRSSLPARSRAAAGDREGWRGEGAGVRSNGPLSASSSRPCGPLRRTHHEFGSSAARSAPTAPCTTRPGRPTSASDSSSRSRARNTRPCPRCRPGTSGRSQAPPHPHGRHVRHEGRSGAARAGGAPEPLLAYASRPRRRGERRTGSPPVWPASAEGPDVPLWPATTRRTRP